MKNPELIFIPTPAIGHLISTVEAAKLFLRTDDRLSITLLIFNPSSDSKLTNYIDTLVTTDRFRVINIPLVESDSVGLNVIMENQKPQVRETVSNLISTSGLHLAGFVLDMFCTSLMSVADEFGVPSYIFFTSGAAFLGLMFLVQLLHDEQKLDPTQFKDSVDVELAVPTLAQPLPARVLPSAMLDKDPFALVLSITRSFRKAKGIIVNTFMELESLAIDSLSCGKNPPVYPVGPILNLVSDRLNGQKEKEIMSWLDEQPPSSVIFLCFGSMGSFSEDQVKEIACALEHSGHRFLWSLRRPVSKDNKRMEYPTDYENPEEALPAGFLDRTAIIGKIIGWAPQTAILAHPSIGGFVSHCGWNSTLESLWHGVPFATWPMFAEQQFNAFQMVKELELSVEIKMDYRKDSDIVVKAEDVERGINCVLEHGSKVRKNVKEMSEKSKKVLMDGGSSTIALNRFIQDVINNVA